MFTIKIIFPTNAAKIPQMTRIFYVKTCSTSKSSFQCFHSIREREDLLKCYKLLNLSPDCDQNQLRIAFLELVKKFHPDSGSPEADPNKFSEIETAYRKLQDKFSKDRWDAAKVGGEYGLYYDTEKTKEHDNTDEVKEFDIKHTAPQHRQYLSYDGVGSGTPVQRQKQHQKYRAAVAIDNVYNHRINKLTTSEEKSSLLVKDQSAAKKIKTRYGIDRLVEDLIQESMSRGEFDNLSGKGKPLPRTTENPYVDFVTHKINQVLIDNGFVPEWISLQKEIKDELAGVRSSLVAARGGLGPWPLTAEEETRWRDVVTQLQPQVKALNDKISKYNLLVPLMQKQLLLFKLDTEAERQLKQGKTVQELSEEDRKMLTNKESSQNKNTASSSGTSNSGILSLFSFIFK